MKDDNADLHGATVHEQTVELLGGLGSGVGLAENDGRNATAGAVLVVGKHHFLDRTCRLGEVFL